MSTADIIAVARLRHRLSIEEPIETQDDAGGHTINYVVSASVWGEVIPTSGSERIIADRLAQVITHRIRIRYRDGVYASQRMRLYTRTFNIKSVYDPFGDKRWLVCLAEEII